MCVDDDALSYSLRRLQKARMEDKEGRIECITLEFVVGVLYCSVFSFIINHSRQNTAINKRSPIKVTKNEHFDPIDS